MSLTVTQFLVGGFDNNCSYICMDQHGHAAVIDPTGNIEQLLQGSHMHNLTLQAIWLTHTHHDHTDRIQEIRNMAGDIPIYVHDSGLATISSPGPVGCNPLLDGTEILLGEESVQVLHTPGHSPDSVCFFYPGTKQQVPWLISGDTIFVHGCGRTTPDQAPFLYESLQRLKKLPDATTIYPGHDYGPTPHSTLGEEKEQNRFLQADSYEAFFTERFPNRG